MLIEGLILWDDGLSDGWISIEGDRIQQSGMGRAPSQPDLTVDLITPGLWDLQVNGAGGLEVTEGQQALAKIDHLMLTTGVTSYLPTIVTTDDETSATALTEVKKRMREQSPIVGVHLEGPFLSPQYCGVHREALLRTPETGVPAYYADPVVRLVTLAPELPGALRLIQSLVERDVVVSIGHTASDEKIASLAVEAGARMTTHVFNAMPEFHHRRPGVVGWALTEDRGFLGVIADGQHLAPTTLALLEKSASDRVILVTDMASAAMTRSSTSVQGGVRLRSDENGQVRTLEGHLAGGDCSLAEMARRWTRATGCGFSDALRSATWRPAGLLGVTSLLDAGAPANIALWDGQELTGVVFRGKLID